MMSEAEKQQVLQTSQILMQREEYESALEMLQPLECILASWMKGKIYMSVADKIANSFEFKYYSTEAQRKQYRDILTCAHDHLYQTGCLMPSASLEIQEQLNSSLWYEIGKVENELARTRPVVEDDNNEGCDYEGDEFEVNEKHHIESMVDQIEFWTL